MKKTPWIPQYYLTLVHHLQTPGLKHSEFEVNVRALHPDSPKIGPGDRFKQRDFELISLNYQDSAGRIRCAYVTQDEHSYVPPELFSEVWIWRGFDNPNHWGQPKELYSIQFDAGSPKVSAFVAEPTNVIVVPPEGLGVFCIVNPSENDLDFLQLCEKLYEVRGLIGKIAG